MNYPCIIYFRLLGESHVRQITKPICELQGDTHVFGKPIIGQEESSVSLYSEALVAVCDNCLLLQAKPVSMQSFLAFLNDAHSVTITFCKITCENNRLMESQAWGWL